MNCGLNKKEIQYIKDMFLPGTKIKLLKMEDIQAELGPDATRFKAKVPKTGNVLTLQSRINDVLKFLNSPTSTISGIKKTYERRAMKVNQHYGLELTWQDMADFFENGVVEKAFSTFASDTAMKIMGKYYRHKDEIQDIFDKYEKDKKAGKKVKLGTYKEGKTRLTRLQMEFLYENRDQAEKLFGEEKDDTKPTV